MGLSRIGVSLTLYGNTSFPLLSASHEASISSQVLVQCVMFGPLDGNLDHGDGAYDGFPGQGVRSTTERMCGLRVALID